MKDICGLHCRRLMVRAAGGWAAGWMPCQSSSGRLSSSSSSNFDLWRQAQAVRCGSSPAVKVQKSVQQLQLLV